MKLSQKGRVSLMNTAEKLRQRECLAFHEAGHAVIARALGVRVEYILMLPNDGSVAHVHFDHTSKIPSRERTTAHISFSRWPSRVRMQKHKVTREGDIAHVSFPGARMRKLKIDAIIYYAGMVAERMAGFRCTKKRKRGHRADHGCIGSIVRQMHLLAAGMPVRRNKDGSLKISFARAHAANDELRPPLERETEMLVTRHWPDIERLARVLRRRDFVGAAELERLLVRKSAPHPSPMPEKAPHGRF
jgi:hypothetical protein